MKRKDKVILGVIVVVGCTILGLGIGVKALLEKPFPIRNAGVSDKEYAMALEKIDTFAEELKDMDIDGIEIHVWDDFDHFHHYLARKGIYKIYIDYQASAEEIREDLIKHITQIKARVQLKKKIQRLIKELGEKGLHVEKGMRDEQSLHNCLKRLNNLSVQEIKDLKIEGVKINIGSGWGCSWGEFFFGRVLNKTISIDHRAPLEEIKDFIVESISNFEEYKKELKEGEKVDKETMKKINSLKKSISKKLGR